MTADSWDKVIETNLNSCFLLSQIAAQAMARRRAGKIINIASEYSRFGNGIAPSYAASKGALIQLTKSMAIELAPHNIQVNAIVPGWIESDMTAPIKSRPFYDEILKRTPGWTIWDARGMRGCGNLFICGGVGFRDGCDDFRRRRLRDPLSRLTRSRRT